MVFTTLKLPLWNGPPIFFCPFRVPRIEKIGGDLVRREDPVPPPLGDGLEGQSSSHVWWLQNERLRDIAFCHKAIIVKLSALNRIGYGTYFNLVLLSGMLG